MKKSQIIALCAILAFSCIIGDAGDAQMGSMKKSVKSVKNIFKKDKKKAKRKPAKTNNAKIDALALQLNALEEPDGIDNDAKPEKLKEEPIAGTKQETPEQAKTIDGRPVTYITTTERFKASAAFDQQVLLDPGADVIYPGAVILGHTIADGTYQEITRGKKRPITISYDLTNVKKNDKKKSVGKVTGKIVPSKSAFAKLHNEIMGQKIEDLSGTFSFEETKIYSESDFSIKFNFGVGYNAAAVETKVNGGFDYSKGNKKNKYMVKFMETFYTVNVDQGKDTFLYESFDIKDFKGYRPVYVASVAYGRLAYLTIESDETWDKIKADLDVAVKVPPSGTEYSAKFEAAVNNLKTNSKINITSIGSSGKAFNLEDFLIMLRDGGFSSKNSGEIVAYKLRFVDDNSIANTIYNDEYTITRTVEKLGEGIDTTFTLYKMRTNVSEKGGKNIELYGNLEMNQESSQTRRGLWGFSRSKPNKVNKSGETGVNSSLTYRVPSDNAKFDIYLTLMEADSLGRYKLFSGANPQSTAHDSALTIMLNNFEDGKEIVIKSYLVDKKSNQPNRSEWVEFYIRVNKKYIY